MNSITIDMAIAAALLVLMALRYGALVRPRWKLPGKVLFYLGVSLALAATVGHWSLIFIIGHQLAGFIGHLVICHKHEIHWWTCEPRDRYLALQTRWAEGRQTGRK